MCREHRCSVEAKFDSGAVFPAQCLKNRRAPKYRKLVIVLFASLLATGCGTRGLFSNSLNGEPIIADEVWLPGPKAESKDYMPPACDPNPSSDSSSDAKNTKSGTASSTTSSDSTVSSGGDPYASWSTAQIETCTNAMFGYINVRFGHYEDALQAANSTWNTAADLSIIGMGTTGSLIGGPTAQVLNAISGAVAGTQGKINSDVLYSHSINIILQQMKTNRAAQGIVIQTKLQNHSYNNMYEAAIDLYNYARAGSWTEALLSLEGNTGGQASDCVTQEQLNAINASQANAGAPPANSNADQSTQATTPSNSKQCPVVQPGQPLSLTDAATVKRIQEALNNTGIKPQLDAKGAYDLATISALVQFETAQKLTPTAPADHTLDPAVASALKL